MRILLLFFLWPAWLFGQVVEPRIHPGQIGQFGATYGQVLKFDGSSYSPSSNPIEIGGQEILYGTGTGVTSSLLFKYNFTDKILDFDAPSTIRFNQPQVGRAFFSFRSSDASRYWKAFQSDANDRLVICPENNDFSILSSNVYLQPSTNLLTDGYNPVNFGKVGSGSFYSVTAPLVTVGRQRTQTSGYFAQTVQNFGGYDNFLWYTPLDVAAMVLFGSANSNLLVMRDDRIGINDLNPQEALHVNGKARIILSGGIATTLTGRDVSNNITNVSLGANLSMSSGVLSVTPATNTFVQGGNSFAAAAVLGTNDANTMRVKANSYGFTINPTGYIQLDDTPTGPPSTPPAGSLYYSSNSQSLFFQEDAGAANTVKILTDKSPAALLLITGAATPGGVNYNIRCDANAGAFTVTLGASLQEGKPYLVRCTRNSTNAITFTAASGYTLGIDTDTALNPTTLVSGAGGSGITAPAKIYLIQRIGTIINIK